MVSSVTSAPYFSYLNQLQGVSSTATTASDTASTAATSASAAASATTGTSAAEASALLNNANSFSPEILSLLQQNSSGNFDPISTLLGGTSTNNATTNLYDNLFASSVASSLTQARDASTTDAAATTQINAIDSLISETTQASVAYNQTIQQNSQSVIDANSYQADGTAISS